MMSTFMDNYEKYENLASECVKTKTELAEAKKTISKYESTMQKIKELRKSAETERKLEVVRIMEKYTGKIKDLEAFETAIKPCATAIKHYQQKAMKKTKKKADTAGKDND